MVTAGTPYARALGEDKIVDAKWDMEVSEPSVDAWKTLLEELTGTSLGGTGTGQGFGSGHGRGFRFEGSGSYGALTGETSLRGVAPTGFEPVFESRSRFRLIQC